MKENVTNPIIWRTKNPGITGAFYRVLLILLALVMASSFWPLEVQGSQGIVVTGTVVDSETGEALPGVNILVEGTLIGTATDLSGRFSITAPNEQSVLVFSFIGYQTATITVGSQRQLTVRLIQDVAVLEEVVVVGYGIQRKESIVGAISQASGDQIRQSVQGSDLGTALRGSLPGLIALQSTGIPGGVDYMPVADASGRTGANATQFFIRGQKTWNQSSPLILVDGVERDLININPYEIERISLLKDASATAVFGVKGANGVILITTLRGREGRAKLSFDASTTAKTISMTPHLADSYTGLLNKNYAIMHEVPITESSWASITPWERLVMYRDQTYPEYLTNIDWTDEFTRDYAYDQNINMSVSGGTKFVKYYGSLAYLHEGDILNIGKDINPAYNASFDYNRLNWRSNLDFQITPTTTFSTNLAGQFYRQRSPGGGRWSAWYTMYYMPPDTWPVKYSDGTWGDRLSFASLTNGVKEFSFGGYSLARGTDVTTDFVLDQKLDFVTKGLSTSFKVSFDNKMLTRGANLSAMQPLSKYISPDIVEEITPGMSAAEIKALEDKYTIWNVSGSTTAGYDWTPTPNTYGTESAQTNVYRNLYYQYSINYGRDFGKHAVTGLALVSRQERATGSEFMSFREDWVGRVTYNFDRKYLAEFNAAYNGSEKFANKYRFGFFPSMAFGWVVSNESFFEPVRPVMNVLKFRYSDGKVGSDEGIDRWLYVGSWDVKPLSTSTSIETLYRFGAPYIQNAYPFRYERVIANPEIHWETARKQDIGVETEFFDGLIQLNFDYFMESRTDIFLTGSSRAIPAYYGAFPVSANEGAVDVKGWELEGQIQKTFMNGLYLWGTYAHSYAKEKVIARGDAPLLQDYQKLAGYQIGQPKVTLAQDSYGVMSSWNDIYTTAGGLTNANLMPGDFRRVDYNSDGYIDGNDAAPYGYPARPQYTYSPAAGFSYKKWTGNMRFYGVYNIEGTSGSYTGTFSNALTILFPWDLDRRWSPENNNTTTATTAHYRVATGGTNGYVPTSRAYLRLQSAEITYTLDGDWVKRLGLSNFRLKLSGNNLFLWSKMYEDLDFGGPATTDQRLTYPVLKRYNFGISVNFR